MSPRLGGRHSPRANCRGRRPPGEGRVFRVEPPSSSCSHVLSRRRRSVLHGVRVRSPDVGGALADGRQPRHACRRRGRDDADHGSAGPVLTLTSHRAAAARPSGRCGPQSWHDEPVRACSPDNIEDAVAGALYVRERPMSTWRCGRDRAPTISPVGRSPRRTRDGPCPDQMSTRASWPDVGQAHPVRGDRRRRPPDRRTAGRRRPTPRTSAGLFEAIDI